MKLRNFKNSSWFPYTIAICSGVILYVLLTNIGLFLGGISRFFTLLSPLIIGIVIAYIMNPLINLFENKIFRKIQPNGNLHTPSVIISLFIVIVGTSVLMTKLIPQLIQSVITFAGNINSYTAEIKRFLEKLNTHKGINIDVAKITERFNTFMNNIFDEIPDYASKAASMTASFGGILLNWVLGFILAIYFQFDRNRIKTTVQQFVRLLMGEKKYQPFEDFLDRCNDIMVRYIACEIIEAIIIGGVNAIFMSIFKMPYVILISVVVGVTNMIPSLGPIIGGIIGGFILLLVSPKHALAFIIFTIVLQIIDGYIIKPKMYGDSLGVPSVLILTFIILGGKMFGIVGILLSIPAAAILSILYTELLIPHMKKWRKVENAIEESREISELQENDDVSENESISPQSNKREKRRKDKNK